MTTLPAQKKLKRVHIISSSPSPPSVYNISLFSHILSSLCVVYPRGRSFSIKTLKRFYLAFLLSVEALLEADPNEFWFGTLYMFSLSLSSFCVTLYFNILGGREGVERRKNLWKNMKDPKSKFIRICLKGFHREKKD